MARRLLTKIGLADTYKGVESIDAKDYNVLEEWEEKKEEIGEGERLKKPFKAYLDVGLKRTTTGAKVFAVMKGAVDGGINVPHSTKRFPGFKKNE